MTFTGTKAEISQFLFKLDKETIWDIKVDKHRNKRSLNANNYAWALINEIANAMRLSKEEVYFQMLKDYGQRTFMSMLYDINPKQYFKYYELSGTFKQGGNTFNSYIVFKGTSEYDSKEMSIFIDGLVQEARALGIETLEDKEINQLIKDMEENYE